MLNRERNAPLLVAISTVLVAVLLAHAPVRSAAAQAANSVQPILTEAELKKLELYVQKLGRDVPFEPPITQLIGLTKPGETMTFRQLSGSDDNDDVHIHYHNRSESNPNIILFTYQDKAKNTVHGYLTDPAFRYILAYVSTNSNNQKLTLSDSKAGFANEIRWWAKQMDEAPDP
jgi:hypothetical protein